MTLRLLIILSCTVVFHNSSVIYHFHAYYFSKLKIKSWSNTYDQSKIFVIFQQQLMAHNVKVDKWTNLSRTRSTTLSIYNAKENKRWYSTGFGQKCIELQHLNYQPCEYHRRRLEYLHNYHQRDYFTTCELSHPLSSLANRQIVRFFFGRLDTSRLPCFFFVHNFTIVSLLADSEIIPFPFGYLCF